MSEHFILNDETKVSFINTKKFKTITIKLYYEDVYQKENTNADYLLARMLLSSNQEYPLENEFVLQLYRLYCTSYNVQTIRKGLVQGFVFSSNIINDKYLPERNVLLQESFHLISTCILKPNLTKESFEKEKRLRLDTLKRIFNNKKTYARYQFEKNWISNRIYWSSIEDSIKQITEITMEDILKAYDRLLHKKRTLLIVGDITEQEIREAYGTINLGSNPTLTLNYNYYVPQIVEKSKTIVENMAINQSHLFIGYSGNINPHDELCVATTLFVNMLGGSSYSTLFQIVRNQYGLAYSVNAVYDRDEGLIGIYAGINSKDYEKTKSLILQVIEDYQNGKVDETLLNITKKSIINSILSQDDQIGTYIYYLIEEERGSKYSMDERITRYQNVTIEDIIKVANLFKLDTSYILKGEICENTDMI